MFGLMAFGFIAIYFMLSCGVVLLAGRWAGKRGRRAWLWRTVAAITMYLLVAWDQIPTYLATEYYCATQAGLTVYKTPEQWKQENPGIAETLTWQRGGNINKVGKWGRDELLNERFVYSTRIISFNFLPVDISTNRLIDKIKGNELARLVVVSSGYERWRRDSGASALKFWVGGGKCRSGYSEMMKLVNEYGSFGKDIN